MKLNLIVEAYFLGGEYNSGLLKPLSCGHWYHSPIHVGAVPPK
jgi:hypothetical protein